jgi:hypothetical protein
MKRITLYRHPECARCRRIARVHRFFDWLGHVECSTAQPPGLPPLKPGEIAVEDARTSEMLQGVAAVRRIAREIPAYAALRPFLAIPAVSRAVDREVRGCEDGACALPEAQGEPSASAQS